MVLNRVISATSHHLYLWVYVVHKKYCFCHLALNQIKQWSWIFHCVQSVKIRSFFWFVFSRIRTEYGEILRISPCSVRMRENTNLKKLRIWTHFTQSLVLLSQEKRNIISTLICFFHFFIIIITEIFPKKFFCAGRPRILNPQNPKALTSNTLFLN